LMFFPLWPDDTGPELEIPLDDGSGGYP